MRAPPSLLLTVLVLLGAGCGDDPRIPVSRAPIPKEGLVTDAHSDDHTAPKGPENRLGKERSPYLRQHRHNPVDWFPWGEEAFAKAKRQDKPIFLSVGYAACHWCHVMEHESFEDPATAKAMNDAFVCVKVDREERPDVDTVYMSFITMSTGRGGWPMTVLMTPEGKPFWGGTYLPAAGVRQLCARVTSAWKDQRSEVEDSANAIAEQVAAMSDGPEIPPTDDSDVEILKTMRDALGARFDARHGGYGSRPKFPPHTELLYHLEDGGKRMGEDERRQVLVTLDAMDRGGIHDQAGGGFHRYSTDERWLLPHFEKMLYDNALLAQAYAGAYALTKAPRYKRVVERLFAWLEREMKQPGGGYASSLDADTEGEEGLTYVWTVAELKGLLSAEDYPRIARLYGIEERGNFQDEATHEHTGANILHWPKELDDAARELSMEPEALRSLTDGVLDKLMAVRAKRPQPGLDDKVITSWNGLLVSAFARAGKDVGVAAYLDRGRELARFLLKEARRADGTLLRFPKGSGPEIPGFCEDYVHLIDGLLDLAAATGEDTWAVAARELTDRLNAEFQDMQGGGFYSTSATKHETLIARSKETWDSPIPSANGVAARVNLRLFALTGEASYGKVAERTLSAFRPIYAHPRMVAGTMALIRALSMRMEQGAAGTAAAVRGDVTTRRDIAQVDVFVERDEAKPGDRVGVVVRIALDDGWHVNPEKPADKDLIGTRLTAAEGTPASLEGVAFPTAASASQDLEGTFEIRAALLVPKEASPGPRKIVLLLRLQACDASTCKAPEEIRLELPLRFGSETGARRHPSLFK